MKSFGVTLFSGGSNSVPTAYLLFDTQKVSMADSQSSAYLSP